VVEILLQRQKNDETILRGLAIGATTFSIKTLSIKTLSIKTLSKKTLSIKTLSIMTLSITTLSITFKTKRFRQSCHFLQKFSLEIYFVYLIRAALFRL
jgi:hypothetical protein